MSASWQPYVDEILKGGHASGAAILGKDNALVWAASGIALNTYETDVLTDDGSSTKKTINEQNEVLNVFKMLGSKSSFYINGTKFMILNYDEEDKKVYFRKDKKGGCMAMTNMCILIGLYDIEAHPTQSPGNCNTAVERIAASLKASNY